MDSTLVTTKFEVITKPLEYRIEVDLKEVCLELLDFDYFINSFVNIKLREILSEFTLLQHGIF